MIRIKRIYDPPSSEDGYRILVDRLWPRGIAKEKAKIDIWLKDIAPSNELRAWFSHDPKKWVEFKSRYATELRVHKQDLDVITKKANQGTVTLLFAAKDTAHNNAAALLAYLKS